MTQNQIAFAAHKETQRHNRATEDLGNRTLIETNRHNVVTEGETYRHNLADESIRSEANIINSYKNAIEAGKLAESTRHNVVSESISDYATRAQAAYNAAMVDVNRGALAINRTKAQADMINAQTGVRNADVNAFNADTKRQETVRSQDRADDILPYQKAEHIGDTISSIGRGLESISRIPGNIINAMFSVMPTPKDLMGAAPKLINSLS